MKENCCKMYLQVKDLFLLLLKLLAERVLNLCVLTTLLGSLLLLAVVLGRVEPGHGPGGKGPNGSRHP